MVEIDKSCINIIEIICKFEKEISTTFMDIQMQILIHQVDDIDITSVITIDSKDEGCWKCGVKRHTKRAIHRF